MSATSAPDAEPDAESAVGHPIETDTTPDRIAALEVAVASLQAQRDAAWGQIRAMRASASWRITYPLRAARRRLPR